jgi:hypothetical protein
MTVVNRNGAGSNGDGYVRPDFLSDAVRGREIDGSESKQMYEGHKVKVDDQSVV